MGYDGNILNYTGTPDHIESVGSKVRRFIDIVRTGLIVHYDMMNIDCYDRVGSTVNDLTGNSHTGTLAGGYDFTTDGGIHFDGIDGNLTYSLNFPTAVTHMIWAKSSQANWSNYNALGANRGPNGINLHTWQGSTLITSSIYDANAMGTSGVYYDPGAIITSPQMYATSSDGNNEKLYVNNVEIIGGTLPASRDNTATDTFYIANDAPGYNSRFSEIVVYAHLLYDRQLSFDEVKQNVRAMQSRF